MNEPNWSEELVSRFADAMRRRRMELKLSAQDVADRTAALGHPINRSAIAAWENHGRGDRLMLGDALVLAEILDLPLPQILAAAGTPSGSDNRIAQHLNQAYKSGKEDAIERLANFIRAD